MTEFDNREHGRLVQLYQSKWYHSEILEVVPKLGLLQSIWIIFCLFALSIEPYNQGYHF